MRRLIISTFVVLGVLGLSAGAAAQYVTPPGGGPAVGEGQFTGPPTEVLGDDVERPDSGGRATAAGFGGTSVQGTSVAGEVAETETETFTPLPSAEDRDLLSRQVSRGEGRTSLLALTGAVLAVLLLIAGALLGGGALLRQLRNQEG